MENTEKKQQDLFGEEVVVKKKNKKERAEKEARRERINARNAAISKDYQLLVEKHPKWRHSCLVEELEKKYFLSKGTIEHVLRGDYEKYYLKD